MSFAAGQRIESRCTKCKDTTGHIVVVVVDDMPVKVECCACGSIHKYYPPASERRSKVTSSATVKVGANQARTEAVQHVAKKQAQAKKLASVATSSTASVKKTIKKTEDYEQLWKSCLAKTVAQPKEYTITMTLDTGSVIEHSVFGVGIVQEILASDKASVLFQEGLKTLKCVAD